MKEIECSKCGKKFEPRQQSGKWSPRKMCFVCNPRKNYGPRFCSCGSVLPKRNWNRKKCFVCSPKRQATTDEEKRQKSYANVKLYRQRLKARLVAYKGGKCAVCGYDKWAGGFDFHHLNPDHKDFSISEHVNKSFEFLRKEADKCVLLCCRCHREVHGGIINLVLPIGVAPI